MSRAVMRKEAISSAARRFMRDFASEIIYDARRKDVYAR